MKRYLVCVGVACGALACGDKLQLALVTTTPACEVSTITVSPSAATLHVGDTLRAIAKLTPCPASQPPAVFHWRLTNASAAGVDSLTGLITALATGMAVVTATEVVDPTVVGAMTLTVVP